MLDRFYIMTPFLKPIYLELVNAQRNHNLTPCDEVCHTNAVARTTHRMTFQLPQRSPGWWWSVDSRQPRLALADPALGRALPEFAAEPEALWRLPRHCAACRRRPATLNDVFSQAAFLRQAR